MRSTPLLLRHSFLVDSIRQVLLVSCFASHPSAIIFGVGKLLWRGLSTVSTTLGRVLFSGVWEIYVGCFGVAVGTYIFLWSSFDFLGLLLLGFHLHLGLGFFSLSVVVFSIGSVFLKANCCLWSYFSFELGYAVGSNFSLGLL